MVECYKDFYHGRGVYVLFSYIYWFQSYHILGTFLLAKIDGNMNISYRAEL